MKSIVLILPYFGTLPEIFSMWTKTVKYNETIDFLVVSDCKKPKMLPDNIIWKKENFEDFKERFRRLVCKDLVLETPYKLCDYKPLYGYLLSEDIASYDYWGYCDCDLIWGDLRKFLDPLFEEDYDKIFSCGHLTLIKNTLENNRLFMINDDAWKIFGEVCHSNSIHGFDEDFFGKNNIQEIFLQNRKKIYWDDYSINPRVDTERFFLRRYSPKERKFVDVPYMKEMYYWEEGHLFQLRQAGNEVVKEEFAYMHFQLRKMNGIKEVENEVRFKIVPNKFVRCKKIPSSIDDWNAERKIYFGGQRFIQLKRRLIRKVKKVFEKCR